MFEGWKKWRAQRRQVRTFNTLKYEATVALKAGGGFAAPVEMIGGPEAVQHLIEALTAEVGEYVRGSVMSGLCFLYPDGSEFSPTEFTMLGVKR